MKIFKLIDKFWPYKITLNNINKNKKIKNFFKRMILSFYFFFLSLFNFLLANLPFFTLRTLLLRMIGWKIGKSVSIHRGITITSLKAPSSIQDYSVINKGCVLDNRRKINIGKNVSLSQGVIIYTLGHDINHPDFITKGSSVTISDYVVIFSRACIMPGVTLGYGSVVLPHSVVSKKVEDFHVVGGNPATFKCHREKNFSYKLDYRVWHGI